MTQAIPYWQRAGQRAVERSANLEAISHLTKGLEVLATLPDTPERAQQELDVQITLGPALMAHQRSGGSGSRTDLCPGAGTVPAGGRDAPALPGAVGLVAVLFTAGRATDGKGARGELHNLTRSRDDTHASCSAQQALGQTLFFLGESVSARPHLEQGIALYDSQQHHSLAFRYGQDSGVVCRGYVAWDLWLLGYPDQAVQRSNEALARAHEVAHPFSLAFASCFAAALHQFRRDGAGGARARTGNYGPRK